MYLCLFCNLSFCIFLVNLVKLILFIHISFYFAFLAGIFSFSLLFPCYFFIQCSKIYLSVYFFISAFVGCIEVHTFDVVAVSCPWCCLSFQGNDYESVAWTLFLVHGQLYFLLFMLCSGHSYLAIVRALLLFCCFTVLTFVS